MGDRISISFVNGDQKSPAFFSHWAGTSLLDSVETYLDELRGEIDAMEHPNGQPLDRLEPGTVMVDFIRWVAECEVGPPQSWDDEFVEQRTKRRRITSNFYLGKDSEDGDNSDNGHVEINLADRDNEWMHYCHCGNPNCELR